MGPGYVEIEVPDFGRGEFTRQEFARHIVGLATNRADLPFEPQGMAQPRHV